MALTLWAALSLSLAGPTPTPTPEPPDAGDTDGPDEDFDEEIDEDLDQGPDADPDEEPEDEPEDVPEDEPDTEPASVPEPEPEPEPQAGAGVSAGASVDSTTTDGGATVFVDDRGESSTPKFLQPLRLGEDSLILGGYIQPGFIGVADTEFNQDDQEGFDFANARLTGRGTQTVHKKLYVGFKFNFDVNRGNFGVRDVYGTIGWRDGLIEFDVGQMKQPFSLALIQSESQLQFALSPRTRIIAFGRDQGFRLSSEKTLGRRFWLSGQFMMANGEGGFRARRNLDDKFQYTGRVEVGPLGKVAYDEPDLTPAKKSKLRFVLAANAGHTESLGKGLGINDVGAAETRVGADARMHWHGASFRAEYLHGFRAENGDEEALERWAFNVQAGYVLPIPIKLPRFEVVFRYTQSDINTDLDGTEGPDYVVDNTEVRFIEPGLSIYLFGHAAKLHMSYLLTDLLEGPRTDVNGAPLIGDTFFAFFQFAWL